MATATPAQARGASELGDGPADLHRQRLACSTRRSKSSRRARSSTLTPTRIEVLVHPQSIVHSMVGFRDGSIMAQLGPSDMREAIGYALNWPERRPLPVERLDLAAIGRLDLSRRPTRSGFPALRLARRGAGARRPCRRGVQRGQGGRARRLSRRAIGFLDMAVLVEHVLEKLGPEAAAQAPATTLKRSWRSTPPPGA